MSATEQLIEVECPDCHWSGEVPADVNDGTAFWVCPSTWCDRTFIDPSKATDWWDQP